MRGLFDAAAVPIAAALRTIRSEACSESMTADGTGEKNDDADAAEKLFDEG